MSGSSLFKKDIAPLVRVLFQNYNLLSKEEGIDDCFRFFVTDLKFAMKLYEEEIIWPLILNGNVVIEKLHGKYVSPKLIHGVSPLS